MSPSICAPTGDRFEVLSRFADNKLEIIAEARGGGFRSIRKSRRLLLVNRQSPTLYPQPIESKYHRSESSSPSRRCNLVCVSFIHTLIHTLSRSILSPPQKRLQPDQHDCLNTPSRRRYRHRICASSGIQESSRNRKNGRLLNLRNLYRHRPRLRSSP